MTGTQQDDAFEVATAVAPLLDEGPWTPLALQESDGTRATHRAALVRAKDGASIAVELLISDEWKGVRFRGEWPCYADGHSYVPVTEFATTCTAKRSPASLAGSLARNVLADYLPRYRLALTLVRQADAFAAEGWAAAERVAEAVGARLPSKDSYAGRFRGVHVELVGDLESVSQLQIWPPHPGRRAPRVCFRVLDVDEGTAIRIFDLLKRARTAVRGEGG